MIRWVGALCAAGMLAASCRPTSPVVLGAPLVTARAGAPTHVAGVGALWFGIAGDGRVTLFGSRGASVLVGGAVVGSDTSARGWTSAASIPSPDGHGAWVVGVDATGHVLRILATGLVDDVSDRWGIVAADHVTAVAAYDEHGVAFALEHTLAVADGTSVVRYDIGGATALAGGAGRIAMVLGPRVRVFTPARNRWVEFVFPDVRRVRIDDAGKLVVLTSHALYREDEGGSLQRLYETRSTLRDMVAPSRTVVWFVADGELGEVTPEGVAISHGAGISPHARLFDRTGDDRAVSLLVDGTWVHLVREDGAVAMRTVTRPASRPSWAQAIEPIFARACVPCHLPGGSADVDLSTEARWERLRGEVREQVMVARSMPPSGHALSDADRATLAAWVGATPVSPSPAPQTLTRSSP